MDSQLQSARRSERDAILRAARSDEQRMVPETHHAPMAHFASAGLQVEPASATEHDSLRAADTDCELQSMVQGASDASKQVDQEEAAGPGCAPACSITCIMR